MLHNWLLYNKGPSDKWPPRAPYEVCVRFQLPEGSKAADYREKSGDWIRDVVAPWVEENIEDDCFWWSNWEFPDNLGIGDVKYITYTFFFYKLVDAALFRLKF